MAQNPNTPNTPQTPNNPTTFNTNNTTPPERSGSNIAFIVGGLVVLVAVIAYFLFAGPSGNDETVIRVETPAAVEPAPAAPAAPAPPVAEEPAPVAPVEGTGTTETPVPGN